MDQLEQENRVLRDEVATLKENLERLNGIVEYLSNQSALNNQEVQGTVISEIVSTLIPVVSTVAEVTYSMPPGFPWGMPPYFTPAGYRPLVPEVPAVTTVQAIPAITVVMTSAPPRVNITPHILDEPIFHRVPSETVGLEERMDGFQGQFSEMQKELRALRGKDLFGKSASDLCLVPNVKVPLKFKVPDFEKYKGNTCLQSHLIMYARKMSAQTDNDQLPIHYFQDSLTGAALRWYMGLDSAKIRTFNDLGGAFIKQYKYNMDMAPDRDQLRAMAQKDKENFKEYAQCWRELAA
ncbi:unnamed protein product [Lathyrus sativus]|nr:unnamed protein product [Lathyrus sativus]